MGAKDLRASEKLRSVAVIIPVRNESATIRSAVESAISQNYPDPLEVIVVDGRSDDDTASIARSLSTANRPVRVIDNPGRTAPAGMNVGLAATDAEVVVRCDGHALLPSDYVATAVEVLNTTGADNVGGVQHVVGTTTTERAIAAAMGSRLGVGNVRFRTGGPPGEVDTVYLGVYRRGTLDRLDGFDASMVRNQDYELNYRIRKNGGIVWFDPRLVVEYRPRSSLGRLWRQYFDYGRGKRSMLRRHPASLRLRQVVAPLLVLGLLGSVIAALTPWRMLAVVIPGIYAAGVTLTSIISAIRNRDSALFAMIGVLPTMHLAWGSGFLFGRTIRSAGNARPSPGDTGHRTED